MLLKMTVVFFFRRAALWVLFALSLLLLYRIEFAFVFSGGEPPREIVRRFCAGLRFDLATLPLLIGPALLFEPITRALAPAWTRALSRGLAHAQLVWLCCAWLLLQAGLVQFRLNQKLPGAEFFAYSEDFIVIASAVLAREWPLILPCLLPGLAVLYAAARSQLRYEPGPPARVPARFAFLFVAMLLPALVALVRGGMQAAPVRPADALASASAYLNQVPLNPVFTLYHGARETGDFPAFFSRAENTRAIARLFARPDASAESPYPLVAMLPRSSRPPGAPARPHIVVILLESFSSVFLAEHGGEPRLTPVLNHLSRDSVYFPRFFAAGGRSANAIFSGLTGIPDRAGRSILRSPGIQSRFGALPALLGRLGYRRVFLHNGDLRFDSLDRVLPRFGFERTVGAAELRANGFYSEPGENGPSDQVLFTAGLRELDRGAAPGPVFALLFTAGTHHPYDEGPPPERVFTGSGPAERLRNAVRTTDRALGEFLEAAGTRPWFRDTVFVVVADHSHHAGLSFLDDLHVPLLFHAPAWLKPARNERVGTHLDLLPTLLALAGGASPYAALGRDLLAGVDRGRLG